MFEKIKESMEKGDLERLETIDSDGTIRRYNYINNIPLNASNPDLLVNFLEYWEEQNGELVYHNTWITSIKLHQDNGNAAMRGGRAGFPIENETFNLATKSRI